MERNEISLAVKIAPGEPNSLPLLSTTGIFIFPSRLQTGGSRFDPWVEKVPLEEEAWELTQYCCLEKHHGQRSPGGPQSKEFARVRARLSDERRTFTGALSSELKRDDSNAPPHSWRADRKCLPAHRSYSLTTTAET